MSVQRPTHRAIEQDEERVRRWKSEEYPDIAKRAKIENAVVYRGDGTAIKHDTNRVTGYAPKGQTPILKCHDGRWKTATMVSAVSNRGLLYFKIRDKPIDQHSFISFLKSMIEDEQQKFF